KTIKCPLVNNTNGRSYYEFINDFQFYNNDPHKFTIISNQVYFMAEAALTDVYILPEYFYDPKGLLQNFTAKQMSEESEQLKSEPKIKEFADDFNSEKRMRDPDFISGSGAYKFLEWKTNERITFTKKKNWWGEQFQQENCYFEAFPEKIFFQIIKDNTTAIVSLKAGNLDVMRSIKSKDFAELPKSKKFSLNFNAYTPLTYSYTYLGINTTSPCLNDKLTRQAIACLTDVDKMIQTIKYGQAHRVIGPVLPSKKKDYNTTIPNYNFDPEKAKELLAKAGWQNTNGDETLDKMINGKRTEFIIDFIINNESDDRKAIALLFQENAKKVGIKVNILSYDWAVFLEKSKDHRFDLMTGMWVGGPGPDDFKQIFHTRSEQEESANYYNFSNAEADSIITSVRTELNEGKRSALYKRFQEILHEEVPMVFLWTPTERIAVSKKFENAYPSDIRPGYWVQGFKMKAMN
ncbi:MAG TPA: ABC transporter substrate-binding protein, partial [Bacteroidia bacterium]